jgi:hypothetical protein
MSEPSRDEVSSCCMSFVVAQLSSYNSGEVFGPKGDETLPG